MNSNRQSKRNLSGFLFLILFFTVTWILGRFFTIDIDSYRKFLSRFPLIYSATVYIVLYVLISFFVWITKDIFKVVGALLFGPYLSTVFVWLAEMINATVLFNLARILGRDFVKNTLKVKSENWDKRIQRFGFWGIFSLRIIPLVPFRFLDVLAGLTSIRFRDYLLAASLGSPLRIFWIQYILSAVGESIFKQPEVLTQYLLSNRFIFILSLVYFIGAIVLAMILRKPEKVNG